MTAELENTIPDIAKFVPDIIRHKRNLRLLWLRWRLFYEQFRFGSDVESPTMRRLLHKARSSSPLPARTIGAWRQAIRHFSR
ncbi:MAG: Hypothetical protein BHV28_04250 [Candidatus Tokpelaia hoelldobleri]|uniref:Uncharacterized protein n=1 Tax=Candidatus Tokpelaia hoelldobleri TaxID=1902579 RepID=A0A1U9JTE4_9HYPH|nr:MAG: Hypothetical protein BHV28_04250 [Candidatus Tokpelaia hoelldoblerii]